MNEVQYSDTQLLATPTEVLLDRARKNREIVAEKRGRLTDQSAINIDAALCDFEIMEQSPSSLPMTFNGLISLQLRDEGNALLEETRQLNNSYIGEKFRYIEAILGSDLIRIDLEERTIQWGEQVCAEVLHKLRYRIKEDPLKTYVRFHNSCLVPLERCFLRLENSMYGLVWSAVNNMMSYKMFDSMFIKTGGLVVNQKAGMNVAPSFSGTLTNSSYVNLLIKQYKLHGVLNASYIEQVILNPLLTVLRKEKSLPTLTEIEKSYRGMVNDIFEAYPYVSLDPDERVYGFQIAGAKQFGTMSLVGNVGLAYIGFDESAKATRTEAASMRGALMLGWNGKLSFYKHPWRTVEHVYGYEEGLLLSWWILGQIHGSIVTHYLEVESQYRDFLTKKVVPGGLGQGDFTAQTGVYVSWIKQVIESSTVDKDDIEAVEMTGGLNHTCIPQLRRNLLFKILRRCGVRIEQGKGSEIKLLRRGKHPFRLGNHGHVDPTIPSFLAANILRRLEITHDEWKAASASC